MDPIEIAAEACHEANRVWRFAIGETAGPSWDEATHEQRELVRNGVERVSEGADTQRMHMHWAADMIERGWRYGEVKSDVHKRHPNLKPYAELTAEQRAKDLIFVVTAKVFLAVAENAHPESAAMDADVDIEAED